MSINFKETRFFFVFTVATYPHSLAKKYGVSTEVNYSEIVLMSTTKRRA
jgi:hypothetical protein